MNFIDAAEMYPVPARGETQGRTLEEDLDRVEVTLNGAALGAIEDIHVRYPNPAW